jgi:hypothetical protein
MFGLNEAQYNIVKQAARKANDELKEVINGGKKYDHVAAEIITKHYNKSVNLLIGRTQFVWLMGYLNGRFGQSGEYE